jgi:hypothetical protein
MLTTSYTRVEDSNFERVYAVTALLQIQKCSFDQFRPFFGSVYQYANQTSGQWMMAQPGSSVRFKQKQQQVACTAYYLCVRPSRLLKGRGTSEWR